jgi:RHS repeat-associated protein
MIKEGEKTYEYGWLDKVLKVTENGKTLADFEYHNNGQIAKAIRPDKTENFLWDGLALVKRDDTKFINEPHAGGGNPVLAIQDVDADNSKAIFTDMLGTSLGSTVEDQYNNITKTSFGADSSDTSAFFTGKPYINELGYAFLLRNYRADTGKWSSQDLIGYPDGWNNLTYCNNNISAFDIFGALIAVYCANKAVGGLGHVAVIVGNDSNGYNYYSFGSGNDGISGGNSGGSGSITGSSTTETGYAATYEECVRKLNATRDAQDGNEARAPYDNSMTTETTPEQDALAKAYAEKHKDDGYWLLGNNCLDYVEGILDAANVDYNSTNIPSNFIDENRGNGVWE